MTGVLAGASFLLVAYTYFEASDRNLATSAMLVLSGIFIFKAYELGENVLFSKERLGAVARFRLLAYLLANILIVAVLIIRPGVDVLLALASLEAAILLLCHLSYFREDLRKALRRPAADRNVSEALRQGRTALPMFLSGTLVLLMLNLDKLLVYRFMGDDEVGLYNSAAKLVDVLFFLPVVIGSVHAASFARLAAGPDLPGAYRRAFSEATWLTLAVVALLAAMSGFVMPLVYGKPFAPAAPALAWLAPLSRRCRVPRPCRQGAVPIYE